MKQLAVFSLAVAAFTLSAEVVYQNDFSTRTSKNPIPDSRWLSMPYVVGSMVKDISDAAFDYTALWSAENTGGMQDNWREVQHSDNRPFTADVAEDGDNRYLRISTGTSGEGTTGVAHTFGNSFTDGVLRMSFDFKCLPTWTYSNSYLRFQPLTRAALKRPDSFGETILFNFGFQRNTKETETRAIYGYYKEDRTTSDSRDSVGTVGASLTIGNWYRLSADMDVGEGKISAVRLYDLGTGHPSLGTDPGAPIWCVDDKNDRYTKAVVTADNPVEGFALRIKDISKAADNARCVDNIACSWKAPGAAAFESVYENDFSTRRYRTLSPDGSKAFGYTPVERTVISDRFSYVANDTWNKSLEDTTPLLPEPAAADPQPVGYDGWRRSNKSGKATAAVVKWDVTSTGGKIDAEKGGNVLKVCGGSGLGENNFVYALTPLGETVASGVLSCSVDVKTPSEWAPSSLSRYDIGVMLANAAAYEQGYNGNFAFRCGITGNPPSPDTKKSKRFEPYTNTETGWAPEDDTAYRLVSNTWYRIEMTVDLDNRSAGASFKLWEIGENSQARSFVPSVLKFEKTGIPFRNEVDGIGSIGLFASGAGAPTSKKTLIAFDNIVVTKNVGTADETVVYQNVFSTRTRTFDNVDTGRLVGTINIDDGADHWIRRAAGTGPCCIMDADNPCVAAWADGDSGSYAVHSLGKAVKSGSFRADIRPPSFWASRDASSRIASAVLGGDRFLQGCPSGSSAFTTAFSAITFGFTDTTNAKDQFGVCSNVQVYAWNGDGAGSGQRVFPTVSHALDTSHWYRFKADFNAAEESWSMKVYDMGVMRPAAEDADGVLVAESANLGFRNPAREGLSALCFNTQGNAPVLANDPTDPGMALYDNVILQEEDRGVAVIIR